MKTGALFAGYGGIELAVRDVFGAEPAWFVEFDKAPSAILAHHWPGVPNYGDVTKTKWSPDCPACGAFTRVRRSKAGMAVEYVCSSCGEHYALSLRDQQQRETGVQIAEPVHIVTGGSPCQDLSHAGKRAGMKAGTRSGLWASMCDAIDIIRPRLVIWENVRGALSAPADSAVEPCPLCVGDTPGVSLRALGRVLGDLAELGYDAAWYGLRAADVGAPHGRWRVFVLAWPADDTGIIDATPGAGRVGGHPAVLTLPTPTVSDANGAGAHGDGGLDLRTAVSLLPTPMATDSKSAGPADGLRNSPQLRAVEALLPTPAVNDMGASYTPEQWDEWTARMKAAHGNGNGHGNSLSVEALRLMPTPRAARGASGTETMYGLGAERDDDGRPQGQVLLPTPVTQPTTGNGHARNLGAEVQVDFGQYAAAVARWESVTRPAPAPTEPTGKTGAQRLSPRFVEWLMGLPDGHVTDPAIGISRNDQLKALGNGVVPQQCAAAIRHLLGIRNAAIRAEAAA